MLQQRMRASWLSCLLVLALVVAGLPPTAIHVRAQSAEADPGAREEIQTTVANTVYLPVISGPFVPPDFVITNPVNGLSLSGTTFFAAQAVDPKGITKVAFKAGTIELGVDTTAADGFQVFLDAATLTPGPTTLTATASGPGGVTTKSVAVTIVSAAPAGALVDASGAILATSSGNTISVPPGAVGGATSISIQDKTQAQVTQEKGIDWDTLGVTFLGAIEIQSSGAISKPLGVSSVGFGNRIQPGQAVVTYQIMPDQDGDGVGELVVVNGASLAPNGTIVSSPVAPLIIKNVQTPARTSMATAAQITALSGPPGTTIRIEGSGFNPAALSGNLALFRSAVNGETFEMPLFVAVDPVDPSAQIVSTIMPPLAVGAATLTLRNASTSAEVGPIELTVESSAALIKPAPVMIDEFLAAAIQFFQDAPTVSAEDAAAKNAAAAHFTQLRSDFAQLISAGLPTEIEQALNRIALTIQNSDVYTVPSAQAAAAGRVAGFNEGRFSDGLNMLWGLAGVLGGIAAIPAVAAASPVFVGFAIGFGIGVSVAVVGYYACRFIRGGNCFGDPPSNQPVPVCTPSPAGPGGGTTGMGSAPPPGGNGCGNVGGSAAGSQIRASSLTALANGRYTVKIFPQSGTGRALTPFTGATDPGGYFFIPLIPQAEPFKAVAIDKLTGATVASEGVGPALGQSVFLYFDFSEAQANRYVINIGDTITNGVPGPGAGNIETAGGVDIYTFSANAGQQVLFDLQGVDESLTFIHWRLLAPNGDELFDRIFNCCGGSDPGVYTLPESGIYTIRVGEDNDPGTGTYSFKLWDVPPPQQFAIAIDDTIADGAPGVGAGNIEAPGAKDIYTFNAAAGQQVFFDLQGVAANLTFINWRLQAPDGGELFDRIFNCCGGSDPGVYTLAQAGTYTLTVGDNIDTSTGAYSFKLWNVPPPQQFAVAIDDTISDGVPGTGAGNIESPGVKDIYTFNAAAGQQVFFDLLTVQDSLTFMNWQLIAPNNDVLFDRIFNCCGGSDPGIYTLAQAGTYTLIVGDNSDTDAGVYSFKLWNVPPAQQFAIAVGDVIADGAPSAGAGNIESPGAKDIYTFNAAAGQQVFFDLLTVPNSLIYMNWRLIAPNNDVLFDRIFNCCGGSDPGAYTLVDAGIYTIIVGDNADTDTGAYSFQIRTP